MAGETIITIIGNLTGDPELRFTPNGVPVTNFTIASTPRNFDRATNEWKEGDTLFLRCTVWQTQSENVAETLRKGSRVIAQGRLKSRQYETKEGERRTSMELEVEEIGASLRFATASLTKNQRNNGGGNNNGGWGNNNPGNWDTNTQTSGGNYADPGQYQYNPPPQNTPTHQPTTPPQNQPPAQPSGPPQNRPPMTQTPAADPWTQQAGGNYNWGAAEEEPPF